MKYIPGLGWTRQIKCKLCVKVTAIKHFYTSDVQSHTSWKKYSYKFTGNMVILPSEICYLSSSYQNGNRLAMFKFKKLYRED